MLYLILLAAFFLAYSNGANDNFKGVATLFGGGTTDYKKAISWATFTTMIGSLTSVVLAESLARSFSGKGLVPDSVVFMPEFAAAVAIGAAGTVMIATWFGMPVSTTHGLVGALSGGGIVAVGAGFNFAQLGTAFFLPLLASPLIAALMCLITYRMFRRFRIAAGIEKTACACVGEEVPVFVLSAYPQNTLALSQSRISVSVDTVENCRKQYAGSFLGIRAQSLLNIGHFVSAGVVCYARGLNDTPKIAGLLLLVGALNFNHDIVLVALAVALGGWLNARKVAETMSKKITTMNDGQGFTANLITSLLVTTASVHGLPVSTTHVSVGSLFGIGLVTGKANRKVIQHIVWSWLLTLPVAAVLSFVSYWIITHL